MCCDADTLYVATLLCGSVSARSVGCGELMKGQSAEVQIRSSGRRKRGMEMKEGGEVVKGRKVKSGRGKAEERRRDEVRERGGASERWCPNVSGE